jgi:NAD(P)-dependent dehydrogenase (short-subunit alcohol dehydrogenase family)
VSIQGKTVLITGSGVRVGRSMALACAQAGANLIVHYGHSDKEAKEVQAEAQKLGVKAHLHQADLSQVADGQRLIDEAWEHGPLYALVNSASIFQDIKLEDITAENWDLHMATNLRAPMLLSQAFGRKLRNAEGRIVNILDWRALRPGADHLPYTISKAGLAALTQSLAIALAPNITVNGMAFGAILPPADGGDTSGILDDVPADRWADLEEVNQTLRFFLEGPAYVTGEIVHVDGGRHLI